MSNTEIVVYTEPTVDNDFKNAHNRIETVIDMTADAIKETADLAYSSQSPRFYEALSGLLKTQIEAARELLDLHKKKKDIVGQNNITTPQITNKTLIMTTADVLAMINNDKEEEVVVLDDNNQEKILLK